MTDIITTDESAATYSVITFAEEKNHQHHHDDDDLSVSNSLNDVSSSHRRDAEYYFSVVGREEETKILRDAWNRVSEASSSSELVLLHGESGVGKSSLVELMRSTVINHHHHHQPSQPIERQASSHGEEISLKGPQRAGIFVSGKFDQISSQKGPFHNIVGIFGDICDFLASQVVYDKNNNSQRVLDEIGDQIHSQMSESERNMLQKFIPNEFGRFFHQNNGLNNETVLDSDFSANIMKDKDRGTEFFSRLTRACQIFLDIVSQKQPILFFVDDIQWADQDSLAMMEHLICSDDSKNILYVLAYRDDYASLEEWLAKATTSDVVTSKTASESAVKIIDIQLEPLKLSDVHMLVTRDKRIDSEAEESWVFTKLVYEKCNGNPYFIVQFIEMLRIDNLLPSSDDDSESRWDKVRGIARVDVSDGVSCTVDARIQQLSEGTRQIMVLAAHLGFDFKMDVLKLVWEDTNEIKDTNTSVVDEAIVEVEQLSLVNKRAGANADCCFSHDRVHEYLYDMIPDGIEKEKLNLQIGRSLLKPELGLIDKDSSLLFLAVDNMNNGRRQLTGYGEKIQLVDFNRQAAFLAADLGSFSAAASYLRTSIDVLGEYDMWDSHYDMALELYSALAQMACNTRKLKECHEISKIVIQNSRTVLDKQAVLHSRIRAFSLQGNNEEALFTALDSVRELGWQIDEHPSKRRLLKRYLQLKWALARSRRVSSLADMPPCEDKRIIAIQSLLQPMGLQAHINGRSELLTMAGLDILHLSLLYGKSSATPTGMLLFGVLITSMANDGREASEIAEQAFQMINECGYRENYAFATLCACSTILLWRESASTSVEAMEAGFKTAMEYGDTYLAISNLSVLTAVVWHSEIPLRIVEGRMREYCGLIESLGGNNSILLLTRCYWQSILNLLGETDDSLSLDGEVLQESQFAPALEGTSFTMADATFLLCKLSLACHFRSLGAARDLVNRLDGKTTFKAIPQIVTSHVFFALTYLDLTRDEQNPRKNISKAMKHLRVLQQRASRNCRYAISLVGIVQAEIQGYKRRSINIQLYRNGIDSAMKEGFSNFAAIGHERAGLALLREREAVDTETLNMLKKGLELNHQWEADGKVDWYESWYAEIESVTPSYATSALASDRETACTSGPRTFDIPKELAAS